MPKLPTNGSATHSKARKAPKEKKPVVPAPIGAEWLTIPQTALHFNVSERTIWRWIDDKELPYGGFGGSARVSRAAIRHAETRGIGRALTSRDKSREAHTTDQPAPAPSRAERLSRRKP